MIFRKEFQQQFRGDKLEPGVVRGIRLWRINAQKLQGWHREYWIPGENIATCVSPKLYWDTTRFQSRYETDTTPYHVYGTYLRPGEHQVADPECQCGFYAYWGEDVSGLDHLYRNVVVGVIEGYGSVTLGTKGFRAAKAKILAATPVFISDFFAHPPSVQVGSILDRLVLGRAYPDVAVYRDYKRMLAEFPPDNGDFK